MTQPITYQFEDEAPPTGITYRFEDAPDTPVKPSRLDAIIRDWQAKQSKYGGDQLEGVAESFTRSPGRLFRTAGQAAGGVNDLIGAGLSAAYRGLVPEDAQRFIGDTVRQEMQPFAPAITAAGNLYEQAKQSYPEDMGTLEAGANIGSLLPWGLVGSKTATAT